MDNTLEAVYKSSNRSHEGNLDMYNPPWEKQQMIWKQEQEEFDPMPRTEVDELLSHAGYNVRASDLTHVAQRIEVLDALMGSGVSELQSSDTVHYNPSDMMGWLECILEELGPVPPLQTTDSSSEMESVVTNSQVVSVLAPGAVGGPQQLNNNRPSSSSSSSSCVVPNLIANQLQNPPSSSSEVLIPSIPEEDQQSDELSGVRLVHLLFACANAVQRGDNNAAVEMIQQLRILMNYSSCSAGAMSRVASHFVDALSRRIGGPAPPENSAMDEILHFHFYETCPYLKFAHFTANQAIVEAVAEASSVHVIDLNLHYGLQWPALIQSLAMRPGGPPSLRLTGIGPPQSWSNNKDSLQEIGVKLTKLAETLHVDFKFQGVVAARVEEIQPRMLTLRRGDAVVVNSMFQLHKVLGEPETDTHWRSSRIDDVLRLVWSLKPAVVTVVEQDADHNSPVFMDRFMSALHYYSTMFDSLDACNLSAGSMERMVVEAYLGKEIGNIIACEGPARTERHETLGQWRNRMGRAGFKPLCLGSNAFNHGNMLLNLFPGVGYKIEEKQGCLTLGWHTQPLVAVSAWQCC